jgi:hypothetical protein
MNEGEWSGAAVGNGDVAQGVSVAARLRTEAGESWPATIIDIGLGGAGLVVERPVERGVRVLVELALPRGDADPAPLEASGEVRYVSPLERGGFRLGLQFEPLGADVAGAIAELVGHLEKRGAQRADVWQR